MLTFRKMLILFSQLDDNNQFIFLVFITLKCYCVMSFRKLYLEHLCVCACRCSFQGGQGRKCFTVGTLLRQEGTATLISKQTLQTLGVHGTFTSEIFFSNEWFVSR